MEGVLERASMLLRLGASFGEAEEGASDGPAASAVLYVKVDPGDYRSEQRDVEGSRGCHICQIQANNTNQSRGPCPFMNVSSVVRLESCHGLRKLTNNWLMVHIWHDEILSSLPNRLAPAARLANSLRNGVSWFKDFPIIPSYATPYLLFLSCHVNPARTELSR